MKITRQQQLLSLIKRLISTELLELNHELFHDVVVTHVHLSNNGRECRIYVVTSPETIKLLNTQYRQELQHAFTKHYVRKVIPTLQFLLDQGETERMEELLAQETETEYQPTKESHE